MKTIRLSFSVLIVLSIFLLASCKPEPPIETAGKTKIFIKDYNKTKDFKIDVTAFNLTMDLRDKFVLGSSTWTYGSFCKKIVYNKNISIDMTMDFDFQTLQNVTKKKSLWYEKCSPYDRTANSTTYRVTNCTTFYNGSQDYTDLEYRNAEQFKLTGECIYYRYKIYNKPRIGYWSEEFNITLSSDDYEITIDPFMYSNAVNRTEFNITYGVNGIWELNFTSDGGNINPDAFCGITQGDTIMPYQAVYENKTIAGVLNQVGGTDPIQHWIYQCDVGNITDGSENIFDVYDNSRRNQVIKAATWRTIGANVGINNTVGTNSWYYIDGDNTFNHIFNTTKNFTTSNQEYVFLLRMQQTDWDICNVPCAMGVVGGRGSQAWNGYTSSYHVENGGNHLANIGIEAGALTVTAGLDANEIIVNRWRTNSTITNFSLLTSTYQASALKAAGSPDGTFDVQHQDTDSIVYFDRFYAIKDMRFENATMYDTDAVFTFGSVESGYTPTYNVTLWQPNNLSVRDDTWFNFSYVGTELVANCSFWFMGKYNASNSTTNNNTITYFHLPKNLTRDGARYSWNVSCNGTFSGVKYFNTSIINWTIKYTTGNFSIKPNASVGIFEPVGQNSTKGAFNLSIFLPEAGNNFRLLVMLTKAIPPNIELWIGTTYNMSNATKIVSNATQPAKAYNITTNNETQNNQSISFTLNKKYNGSYDGYIYLNLPKNITSIPLNISSMDITIKGVISCESCS